MRIGLREALLGAIGVAIAASLLGGDELRIEGPYVGPAILLWLLLLWLVAGDAGHRLRRAVYVTPVVLFLLGLRLKFDADGCLEWESDTECERSLERTESLADAALIASAPAAAAAVLVALWAWRRG